MDKVAGILQVEVQCKQVEHEKEPKKQVVGLGHDKDKDKELRKEAKQGRHAAKRKQGYKQGQPEVWRSRRL